MTRLRGGARAWLSFVRARPYIHGPVHLLALALALLPWGRAFIGWILHDPPPKARDYADWVAEYDTLTAEDRRLILQRVAALRAPPLISILMPAYATPEPLICAAIESVRRQLYPHWELCVADDASPGYELWNLLRAYAHDDPRIKVTRRGANGGISAATNSALEMAAGAYVALMDHDDILPEHALYEVAAAIDRDPDVALLYSDEDKIDAEGVRSEPYFKPGFNYELLLRQNLISHLGVYRREVVVELGGLRSAFDGSQDWDLALRVVERVGRERVRHIPAVLYHWRNAGEQSSFSNSYLARCADAGRRAVEEHLARTGQAALVTPDPRLSGWLSVRRLPPAPKPMVSVIVPSRDRAELLEQCARGVLESTDYHPLELVIVDNGSTDPEALALLRRLQQDRRVRVIEHAEPFNFSRLNNIGAAHARGEILVLLNNDVSMIHRDWLYELVANVVLPEVGAVGARLLYPNGALQHGGVVLGVGGAPPVAGHLCTGAARLDLGYLGHLALPRNVSAVTAACLAIRRGVYEEVGGLDESIAVAFNDVDLCLRLRALGYEIVWTSAAELYHHESASRGLDIAGPAQARFQGEVSFMRARWGEVLDSDPFFNPNFDRRTCDYRLAFPPNGRPSWRPPGTGAPAEAAIP
jgi:GT2 family glycosyltransferase